MSRKPVLKLLLAAALILVAWVAAAPPSIQAVNICGILDTVYYSTGGHCVYYCNPQQPRQCFGNVSGTITSQVTGHCYAC